MKRVTLKVEVLLPEAADHKPLIQLIDSGMAYGIRAGGSNNPLRQAIIAAEQRSDDPPPWTVTECSVDHDV